MSYATRPPLYSRIGFLMNYLVLLVLSLALASCDVFGLGSEGQELEVVTFSAEQPTSRAAYADLATFIVPGRVAFLGRGRGQQTRPNWSGRSDCRGC